ncbi:PDR/VanB family oxidoreductase [Thalassospira xiamenensis]|uniref:Uncharacterized protein n=1 Tax=Thalassospira xiamenensis TaxID=220697 RepID=A0A367W749_9PROT|nr:PDR/VanB family oxidoreductase [Thalassospira xiamenensis]KZB55911.1 hypothetical protein AUP41_16520 [Thalassospira xiamenensis]RCK37274.1 hypothetical protein TH24_17015 [Thalassospira xiamenensis]RCK50067.1 hypothetical protein TH44_12485 [Thalassospira xiamenensis]
METFNVKVASVREVATDIFEYVFEHPDKMDLPEFVPGAHIHVNVPTGDTRQYSLCNDPADRSIYRIAIKREDSGQGGSVSFVEQTKAGDLVGISVPCNDFELKFDAEEIILIAGGIGITPILCMAKVLERTKQVPCKVFYLTRDEKLTAYGDEIRNTLHADVTIHHDHGDPSRSLDLVSLLSGDHSKSVIYCCGPTGLLHAVRSATSHWPKGSVRFEDFGTSTKAKDEDAFWVRVKGHDERYLVPGDKSILKVLQEVGLDMPSSCEAGTCGTCRMKLIAGEADHRDLVLFDDEMEDNIIICCSRAASGEITIDFPD